MLSIKKMTKSKKKLYDLRHEQLTVQNIIREKKVAEYDIKDDQDHIGQSFKVIFYYSKCHKYVPIESVSVTICRKPPNDFV